MLLQLGDKGDNVKYLQYGLHILCCSPNGFDGEFGNGTLTAVKKFQSKYGLVNDGIVGDVTWNTLKNEIATIQAQLNKKGCSVGTVDGIAGPATYNAVISFQNKNGLTADGQVGTATWDILFDTVSGGTTYTRILKVTSPLMQGDDVKAVQNKLNSLGFNCGTADGYYGNDTKNAVISFQSSKGIDTDGIVGPTTWKLLFNSSSNGSDYSRILKVTSPLMYGDDIKAVQNKLNSLGFNCGTADGYYGNDTKNAVISFQSSKGIDTDGIVGPTTWKLLFNSSSNGSDYSRILKVTSPLMYGDDIKAVQNKLNSLGFNCGTADGYYGNDTKNAVISFQSSKGLTADGEVGPATWNALFNSSSSSSGGTLPGGSIKVFIDAGHGGTDPGAVGNGLNEKDVVLNIAKKLGALLNGRGISIKYSRTTDTYVSLEERARLANAWGADLFVSIHANSATSSVRGTECYTHPTANTATKTLSGNVSRAIASKFGISNRGHKEANFAVLRLSNMPAILVETAFISNSSDANLLNTRQDDFASVIFNEIYNYFGKPVSVLDLIKEVTDIAINYDKSNSKYNLSVLNYLRHLAYSGAFWDFSLGSAGPFVDYFKKNHSSLHNKLLKYIQKDNRDLCVINNEQVDLPHLAATLLGYKNVGILNPAIPSHWFGWGGDLATGMADITNLKLGNMKDKTEEYIADNNVIGKNSSISLPDIYADIDAYAFVTPLFTDKFNVLLSNYFKNVTNSSRKKLFLTNNGLNTNSSLTDINNKIYDKMTGLSGFNYPIAGKEFHKLAITNDGVEPSEATIKAACKSFAKYIYSL